MESRVRRTQVKRVAPDIALSKESLEEIHRDIIQQELDALRWAGKFLSSNKEEAVWLMEGFK